MFLKYAINRASTSGILDNVRMVIETAMVDGFVGSNNVLRTLPQKRAFLLALPNKDRMRLLNMVGCHHPTGERLVYRPWSRGSLQVQDCPALTHKAVFGSKGAKFVIADILKTVLSNTLRGNLE